MIRQKPVKGGRSYLSGAFIKSIDREINRQAKMFNVSRSFVIATAVADSLGVKDQEDYKTRDNIKRFRRRA